MLLHNLLTDGHPKTGSFARALSGKERLKDLVKYLGAHAFTIVADIDIDMTVIGARSHFDFAIWFFAHGLRGVIKQVH